MCFSYFLFLVFFFFFNFHRLNEVIFSWFLLSSLLLSTTIASNRVRHEIHRWISRWKKFLKTPGKLCSSPKLPPANARKNRIFFFGIFRRLSAAHICTSAAAYMQFFGQQKWVVPDWWACWRAACASCLASNAYFICSSMEISQLELLMLE